MSAGVDDAMLKVVLEAVRAVRIVGVKSELQHDHPGEAQRVAQAQHRADARQRTRIAHAVRHRFHLIRNPGPGRARPKEFFGT